MSHGGRGKKDFVINNSYETNHSFGVTNAPAVDILRLNTLELPKPLFFNPPTTLSSSYGFLPRELRTPYKVILSRALACFETSTSYFE